MALTQSPFTSSDPLTPSSQESAPSAQPTEVTSVIPKTELAPTAPSAPKKLNVSAAPGRPGNGGEQSALLALSEKLPGYWQAGPVILPETNSVTQKALHLLEEGDAYLKKRTAEAEQEFERQKKRGYEAGLEEGRLAAAAHHLTTVLSSLEYYETIRKKVVEVITSCLRQLILDLPAEERIYQLVGEALSLLKQQTHITLQVHPLDRAKTEAVLPRLQELLEKGNREGQAPRIELRLQEDLKTGSSILESPLGLIDASLEKQLTNLEKTLKKEVTQL
jgi:type III secretion protein L